MATTRVRTIIGSAHSVCALCGAEADHPVLESRNRRRLLGGEIDLRRYLVCSACGSRSEITGSEVVDIRDHTV